MADRRSVVLGRGDVVARVVGSILSDPEVRAALSSGPDGSDQVLRRALQEVIEDRISESSASDRDAAALRQLEEQFDAMVAALLDRRAEAQPDEFKTRRGIAELQALQDKLLEEERKLRKAAEGLRAESLTTSARAAARNAPLSKDEARHSQELEKRYVSALEQLQEKKRAIADVITSKKRLQLNLPAAEVEARQTVVREHGNLDSLANEIEAKRALISDRLSKELRPTTPQLLQEARRRVGAETQGAQADASDIGHVDLGQGVLTEVDIRRRILELTSLADKHRARAQRGLIFAVAMAGLLPISVLVAANDTIRGVFASYFALLAVLALIIAGEARHRFRNLGDRITDSQNELELLRIENDHPERRALKMLQVNQLDLRRYYDQTLRQGRLVFYLGIVCIALGFAAVGAALLLVSGPAQGSTEQIVVASLGAASALLANFIGVIYLRMFSEITGSVGAFHTRLVGTHDLYFGNFLAAKVTDDGDRERLFADLARGVGRSRQAHTEPNDAGDS